MSDLFGLSPIKRVRVLLPLAMDTPYDYAVPEDLETEEDVAPGDFVLVPLGQQQRIGVVWLNEKSAGIGEKDKAKDKEIDQSKLRPLIRRFDVPPLPAVALEFAEWVARYNLMPVGMILRMMMSAKQIFEPEKPRFGVQLAGPPPKRMNAAREKALAVVADNKIWGKKALAEQAEIGIGTIDGLVKAGTLASVQLPKSLMPVPDPDYNQPDFSDQQGEAVYQMKAAVQGNTYSVSLLDGVTGSGKTEVYFEAVAEALRAGKQVLVLLPEIALTSQFISRFAARFGVEPVGWHSGLSQGARGRLWRAIASGEVRAVIGARSALFLPYHELGLIIVDEEHESAFKQEDRVTYQARDMAVVRAHLGKIPIILASATPSLESYVNARQGRYRHVKLESRFSGQELPEVRAIDLRQFKPDKGMWLSQPLVDAVTESLGKGQQSLLFLNRRGYAPLTLCRSCGLRFDCPQCSAWLVEHRFRGRLQCHHCGFSTPLPKNCPKCGAQESLVPCGPGVERLAEEVRERYPDAQLAILSSDITPHIDAQRQVLETITKGEAQIIIGTQLVAKGHHFPALATVGIVDGDLGLAQGGDPRAAERTFQLLHQVTGRAGRAAIAGRGYIQTHIPENPVMEALISGDRESFLEREMAVRHAAGYPPFGRLASFIISAKMKELAQEYARFVVRSAPRAKNIMVLGPTEAPLAVIRGRHRFRILLKAPRESDIQAYIRSWIAAMPKATGDVRWAIDIDPYNFL